MENENDIDLKIILGSNPKRVGFNKRLWFYKPVNKTECSTNVIDNQRIWHFM